MNATLPNIPDHEILQHLGSGASGEVYRARQLDGNECAVKFLTAAGAMSHLERLRFQREFEVLSRLNHPNILKVYQFRPEVPCFTMELVSGPCLDRWLAQLGDLFLEPQLARFLRCIEALLSALSLLHEQGIIHRDLKPSNVMVCHQNGPKVMDFGLAHVHSDERLTRSGAILGTPLYLAPEQLSGQPPDVRADLYSLGVLLYEASGGELPATGKGLMAFLQTLLNWQPRPLRQCNPRVPSWLADFVARLMAKDVADRFRSASEALDALADPGHSTMEKAQTGPQFMESALVGREAELALFETIWTTAYPNGVLVVMDGEPGVGKSRLWAEARKRALARGLKVYQVTCLEGDPTPYAPFLPLLRWAVEHLQRRGQPLEKAQTNVLGRVLPEFHDGNTSAPDLDEAPAKSRLYELVCRLLAELNQGPGCVICLDDVQWADPASLELLRYTRNHPHGAMILLHRSDEVPPGHLLHSVIQVAARVQKVEKIHLGTLETRHFATVVTSILGGNDISSELSDYLVQASGGNPLYLSELLRALEQTGQLHRSGDRWHLQATATGVDPAGSMSLLVERRLDNLSNLARDVVGAAAVLGKKFRYAILAKMFESVDEEATFLALEELLKTRLLAESPGDGRDALAFYHDRFREVVLAKMTSLRFQRFHRLAAAAYQRSSMELAPPPDVLARHFLDGGDPEAAHLHLRQAAEQARSSHAGRRALSYYQQIYDLGDHSPEVEEAMADLHLQVGEAAKAIELYDRHLATAINGPKRCSLLKRRSQALRNLGRYVESLDGYLLALKALGIKVPLHNLGLVLCANTRWLISPPTPVDSDESASLGQDQEIYALMMQTTLSFLDDPYRQAVIGNVMARQFRRSMRSRQAGAMAYSFAMAASAFVWQFGGFKQGLQCAQVMAERALVLTEGDRDQNRVSKVYRYTGTVLVQLSQLDRGVELVARSVEISENLEDFYGLVEGTAFNATLRYYQGDFAKMLTLSQLGVQRASLGCDQFFLTWLAMLNAAAQALLGDLEPAEQQLAQQMDQVKQLANPLINYLAGFVAGAIHLARGRWTEAADVLRPTVSLPPGAFYQSEVAFFLGDALYHGGDLAGLSRLLKQWARRVWPMPRQYSRWLQLRGLLLGQSDPERAGQALEQSVQLARQCGARSILGRSLLILGRLRQDQGQCDEGLQVLKACQDEHSLLLSGN